MRWTLLLADMVSIGLLILGGLLLMGKVRRRQNSCLGAVYACHPLAIAGVGHAYLIVAVLPVVVALAALSWRLRRWVQIGLIAAAAAGCVFWVWHEATNNARP